MSSNDRLGQEPKSCLGKRVAAWKAEVTSFFSYDWSRLRTLMMEMEEDEWSDRTTTDATCAGMDRNLLSTDLPVSSSFSDDGSKANSPDSEKRIYPKDRLTQLAEQIERRLQSTVGNGR